MAGLFGRYPSLAGRPVIISGGASGIGEALVREFAYQGAKIGFVDIANEAGDALEKELADKGATLKFISCDITNIPAYQAAIEKFAALHGDALVLVNNAANDQRHDIGEVTEADWDAKMAVNLKHVYFAAQAVVPGMVAAGGGSIINFGSVSWMNLTPRLSTYATAKAAMHGMTRSLARDFGQQGIRVNTLVPGWVMTERQLAHWVDDKAEREIDRSQALRGRVMPEDIARMALFLAADDSAMISAQDFLVDGGWAHS